jgi:hypothetical protein
VTGENLKGEMLLIYYSTLLTLLEEFDAKKKGNWFTFSGSPSVAFEAIVEFARDGDGPVQFSVSYFSEIDFSKNQEFLTVVGLGYRATSSRLVSASTIRTEASLAFRIKECILKLVSVRNAEVENTRADRELTILRSEMRDLLVACK